MQTVVSIIGTRPEAIKMAPVVRAIQARPVDFRSCVVVTGQHREMLDQVLGLWGIVPDHDLDLMRPAQSLNQLTSRALEALGDVLARERPDWVLVQGDTTSVMTAALAAFYQGIPVGHVEAGLRTHRVDVPFPEEMNRRFVGMVARAHFAPTRRAYENLLREGLPASQVFLTGNPGVDALRSVARMPYDPRSSGLDGIPLDKPIVLVTSHRRENIGQGLREICRAVELLTRDHEVRVVMPVHPNPQVARTVRAELAGLPGVFLAAPLDYQALIWLLQRCHFVMTDSGGLQEEAVSAGKPVLILRETTERWEGVESGSAVVVGTSCERILGWATRLLSDERTHQRMCVRRDVYGDGQASRRITEVLADVERLADLPGPGLDGPDLDRPDRVIDVRDPQIA